MVIAWRRALPALALLASGCGVQGGGCAGLSDDEAKELATERLRDSFKPGRRHDMLGPFAASQLRAMRVNRQNYGTGNQMNNVTVQFHDPSNRHVVNGRIFPDCEIEWRPQLGRDRKE